MTTPANPTHRDESPIDLRRVHRTLPRGLRRFLPSGGGSHDDRHGIQVFGITIAMLSESLIFVLMFASFTVLKLSSPNWLPAGVDAPRPTALAIAMTGLLVFGSLLLLGAENVLRRNQLSQFRILWLANSIIGILFVLFELREWSTAGFRIGDGLMAGFYYLLTVFHGLHFLVGLGLQFWMLWRSFQPHNYDRGHFGVTATAIFWYFVVALWVALFLLVYVW